MPLSSEGDSKEIGSSSHLSGRPGAAPGSFGGAGGGGFGGCLRARVLQRHGRRNPRKGLLLIERAHGTQPVAHLEASPRPRGLARRSSRGVCDEWHLWAHGLGSRPSVPWHRYLVPGLRGQPHASDHVHDRLTISNAGRRPSRRDEGRRRRRLGRRRCLVEAKGLRGRACEARRPLRHRRSRRRSPKAILGDHARPGHGVWRDGAPVLSSRRRAALRRRAACGHR